MLFYSDERFINSKPLSKYVRYAYCGECGSIIGEQEKFPNFSETFEFVRQDKKNYTYCPYCGEEL